MTATAPAAPKPAKRAAAAKTAGQSGVKKGAAPAKTAAKRAAPAKKRAAPAAKRAPRARKPGDGAKLRKELSVAGDPVAVTIMIRQAARVADRLEDIGALLDGSATAWRRVGIPRLDTDGGRVVVHVMVSELVKEERAQSVLLRNLLTSITAMRGGPAAPPPDKEDDDLVD